MTGPDWATDGRDWPNREASRFVDAGGIRWHVQTAGTGPALLLAHGTAAATHSWRDLFPRLAKDYTVVAPDLPGHGFTEAPSVERMSLPGMAALVRRLLDRLGLEPAFAIGHSAGGAIVARMALDGALAPRALGVLNYAFQPYPPIATGLASVAARVARSTLVARAIAAAATPALVSAQIRNTGSALDPRGIELYTRLVRTPRHVRSAFAMMSQWNLHDLAASLGRLGMPVLMVAGERDPWFPPEAMARSAERLPDARLESVIGAGHLAHEEWPDTVASVVSRYFARSALASGSGAR